MSTNVYAKFCCALLRIKKALGIFTELITTRTIEWLLGTVFRFKNNRNNLYTIAVHINDNARNVPEKTFSANLSNRLLLPTPTKYDVNDQSNTLTAFYFPTRNMFCGMRYLSHCSTTPAAFNPR